MDSVVLRPHRPQLGWWPRAKRAAAVHGFAGGRLQKGERGALALAHHARRKHDRLRVELAEPHPHVIMRSGHRAIGSVLILGSLRILGPRPSVVALRCVQCSPKLLGLRKVEVVGRRVVIDRAKLRVAVWKRLRLRERQRRKHHLAVDIRIELGKQAGVAKRRPSGSISAWALGDVRANVEKLGDGRTLDVGLLSADHIAFAKVERMAREELRSPIGNALLGLLRGVVDGLEHAAVAFPGIVAAIGQPRLLRARLQLHALARVCIGVEPIRLSAVGDREERVPVHLRRVVFSEHQAPDRSLVGNRQYGADGGLAMQLPRDGGVHAHARQRFHLRQRHALQRRPAWHKHRRQPRRRV